MLGRAVLAHDTSRVREARTRTSRTFGEVLDEMNETLEPDERALLEEPHAIERVPLRVRDVFPPTDDEEEAVTRAAS